MVMRVFVVISRLPGKILVLWSVEAKYVLFSLLRFVRRCLVCVSLVFW